MRIRRSTPADAEIPTASMADIAFLLIIFFMLTSAFAATRGMSFTLPEEEQKSAEFGEPGINIWVKNEGQGRTAIVVDRRRITVADLLPYVDEQLRLEPNKPVLLYTDPEAPYAAMIEVYDELMQAEQVTGRRIRNIYVPTTRDVEEYTRLFGFNPFTQGP